MRLLNDYQKTDIIFGTIYFFILYIIGYYTLYKNYEWYNIIVTTILFGVWMFLSKVIKNYFIFTELDFYK